MPTEKEKVKRVKLTQMQDPLNDPEVLNKLGQIASRNARRRAFKNGASVTYAKKGTVYELSADGTQRVIKTGKQEAFPTIEEDLCHD